VNRAGTISLVLGLVAIVTSVFVVGGLVGLAGLVFGLVGLRRVHLRQATNLRAAAAGTVLSFVAVFASLGLVLQSATFVSTHHNQVSAYDRCIAAARSPVDRQACVSHAQ